MTRWPDKPTPVWTQDLQVHWPNSWRFYATQDVLLEAFAPEIFTIEKDVILIRYAENQDLRVSPHGMHLRIIAPDASDDLIVETYSRVLKIIEPLRLNHIRATFSNVRALESEYDEARKDYAHRYYSSWTADRAIADFALLWDEDVQDNARAHYELGVVNRDELLMRLATAAGMSPTTLVSRTPAWLKVRMPRVALYMSSGYTASVSVGGGIPSLHIPTIWQRWRMHSNETFDSLASIEENADRGEV